MLNINTLSVEYRPGGRNYLRIITLQHTPVVAPYLHHPYCRKYPEVIPARKLIKSLIFGLISLEALMFLYN